MKLNQNRLTELISKRVMFDFQILLRLKIIIGEDYLINLKLINSINLKSLDLMSLLSYLINLIFSNYLFEKFCCRLMLFCYLINQELLIYPMCILQVE